MISKYEDSLVKRGYARIWFDQISPIETIYLFHEKKEGYSTRVSTVGSHQQIAACRTTLFALAKTS
jgi:hypothetical protein